MMDYKFLKEQAIEAMHAMGHGDEPDVCSNSGKIAAAFIAADKQRDEALAALEHAKARAESGHHGDLIAYDISLVLDKLKASS